MAAVTKAEVQARWARRYKKKRRSVTLKRIAFKSLDISWQIIRGLAVAIFVIIIALFETSIRRTLEAMCITVGGVSLLFGGIKIDNLVMIEIGLPLVLVGTYTFIHYVTSWFEKAEDKIPETNYPLETVLAREPD